MAIVLPSKEQLRNRAQALYGHDCTHAAALAEVLRCELSAQGLVSGRNLCERAQCLLQPLAALDVARIREVLEELAVNGDVTSGPRGMFAAAPLRAVRLSPGRYVFHGTLPTSRLRRLLACPNLKDGISRHATISVDQEAALADAVSHLGGLILSPRRWAGLDRVPSAGPEWIEDLNHRLDQHRNLAGALDDGLATPWQAYRTDVEGPSRRRWRAAETDDIQPCLWRARHEYGWWRFAWTAGGCPSSSPHARLSRDEACRTQFALDRQAERLLPVVMRKGQNEVALEVEAFLPRAEYRYLTTLGERVETDGAPRYVVPFTAWDEVVATLRERLGLRFTEGGPP